MKYLPNPSTFSDDHGTDFPQSGEGCCKKKVDRSLQSGESHGANRKIGKSDVWMQTPRRRCDRDGGRGGWVLRSRGLTKKGKSVRLQRGDRRRHDGDGGKGIFSVSAYIFTRDVAGSLMTSDCFGHLHEKVLLVTTLLVYRYRDFLCNHGAWKKRPHLSDSLLLYRRLCKTLRSLVSGIVLVVFPNRETKMSYLGLRSS